MIQAINDFNKPTYNAVNIHITKPEVNAKNSDITTINNDNGIYNSVKIDIENPTINTEPQTKIYDYPVAKEPLTYDMAVFNPIALPAGFPVATEYYETSVIFPEESDNEIKTAENNVAIPAPNYTTLEAEKGSEISFNGAEKAQDVKKTEIVEPKEIKPDIDINSIIEKLNDKDYDVQAVQLVEIAKTALDSPEDAMGYITKDVFLNLIDIAKKDTSDLEGPSEKQIEARNKIVANYIAESIAKSQNKEVKLPYEVSQEEIDLANKITPLEQAERNKEYAIYTTSILSKLYIDEIEKQTGDVVPFTDIPGLSDMVDILRSSQNPGVKVAVIEGLSNLQKPEYKDELRTIFELEQNDKNNHVAETAIMALYRLEK